MFLEFRIQNFEVFNKSIELSFEADFRTKKFLANSFLCSQGNALKSMVVYGPNNTGKTCLIEAIAAYRDVLLNRRFHYDSNIFEDSSIVELGADFLHDDVRYRYNFSFDTEKEIFVKEMFSKIEVDSYGNKKEIIFFNRDIVRKEYYSEDKDLERIIKLSSKDSILIYALDTAELPLLNEAKCVLKHLGESIVIVSMETLGPLKTIEALKRPDSIEAKKIVELIRGADLDIDDYKYSEAVEFDLKMDDDKDNRLLEAIKKSDKIMDQFRLVSVHRGKPLPSIKFDSNGTKKIIALASYIVEALDKGKILVVDELDAGLQFKLAREIVALFNNMINERAQFICTTHDVSLLDIRTLLRKDQIWFTDKDETRAYLYSLADFTAENSGIRSESDIYEKYSRGILGALPDPALVDALLQFEGGEA